MPSYVQRNMFDALDVEDIEYEEEEVVQDEPTAEPTAATESAPMSKSAKKRAARAAAKAAAAASSSDEKQASKKPAAAADAAPAAASSTNGVSKEDKAVANGKQQSATADAAASASAPAAAAPAVEKASAPASKEDRSAPAPTKASPPVTPPSTSPHLPSSKFNPELPSTLPHPSANQLPANRKRKTPQDFAPYGPNDQLVTPASPNKNSVKFEDGVLPGEGKEGEKTIKAKAEPKKAGNAVTRTIWTFIMIFGFIFLLCMGHPYMIMLVLLCQTLVYKEITALFDLRDKGANKSISKDGWNKTLNWYFFVVTNYFLYGESIIYYFKHIVFVDAYFIPFAKNHRFISFMLYTVGFVGFVANLNREHLRQQFALFCWVHITLLLIVVSSHFIVNNILEGLIWFFVPASLVINNDVMAYVCGKLFGRTSLFKLSPKKTVEGFVGAFILTLIFALGWGTFWMQFNYMICPAKDLGVNAFSNVVCKPNPVFVWREFEFTGPLRNLLQTILGRAPPSISYAPFQLHCLVMATFASLVAPFGGFFASGFKRAFDIKDFGDSIPGHGGMTDRMDCQFMMGLFAYVYYSSMIRIQYVNVGSLLQTAVVSLTTEEQLELLVDLKRFLEGQGVKVKL